MSVKHWVLIGLAIAIVIGLTALYEHADDAGYTRAVGEQAERENKELVTTLARVRELEAEKDAAEARHLAELEAIDVQGMKELNRVEAAKDRFVADVVAGRLRLYDPGASSRARDCGSPPAETPATASVGDGAAAGGLSREASEFLLGEGGRANAVVVQLTACQQILRDDRR